MYVDVNVYVNVNVYVESLVDAVALVACAMCSHIGFTCKRFSGSYLVYHT